MNPSNRHIYSVSELNAAAKLTLDQGFGQIWLEAEISNFARPASGHWYFSLKDKKAQIRCAFFKGQNRLLKFSPEDGQRLLVRGRISLYEARGEYQLIVEHMEPTGEGDLQRAYEQTKQDLFEAGYFDEEHKKELPSIPGQIGLITSPTGAAIRDVLHVLKRRFPLTPVIVYPTPVQGDSAAEQIIDALKLAQSRDECDVLLLVRGGGSLEDLWPFNNKNLAMTIFESNIPIISGIGHEVDYTIADFIADARAPTPSVAAEIITPDQLDISATLASHKNRLVQRVDDTLRNNSQQLDWYAKQLQRYHPGKRLTAQRQQLDTITRQFNNSVENTLKLSRYRLDNSAHTLNTVSPLATLSRGYSISRHADSAKAIKQASEIAAGDLMSTKLAKGNVISRVESTND